MSNIPENISPYDYARIQLMGQLGSMSDAMRKCADIADHFSQVVAHLGPAPNGAFPPPMPQFNPGPMPDMRMVQQQPLPQQPVQIAPAGKRKAVALGDGEIKKKKVKKIRDPEMPKRPASSYLLFQNEVRQAMKQQNPGMANHEILTTISQRWAHMTPEEKDTYHKRQETAKALYTIEKSAYDARKAPAVDGAAAAIAAPEPSSPVVESAPPPAAIKLAKAVPALAEPSSSEDDSSESSSEDSDDEEEEEEEEPVKKKSKKSTSSKVQQPALKKESRKKIKN